MRHPRRPVSPREIDEAAKAATRARRAHRGAREAGRRLRALVHARLAQEVAARRKPAPASGPDLFSTGG